MPQDSQPKTVLDKDGDVWERQENGWYQCTSVIGGATVTLDTLRSRYGPLDMDLAADMVNSPPHYVGANGVEVIDIIDAFELGHYEATIVAYVIRAERKNGIEDLRKARFYLNRRIKNLEASSAVSGD